MLQLEDIERQKQKLAADWLKIESDTKAKIKNAKDTMAKTQKTIRELESNCEDNKIYALQKGRLRELKVQIEIMENLLQQKAKEFEIRINRWG